MAYQTQSPALHTFPADKASALALLYVQIQDLNGKSPEDLAAMYSDAHQKITNKFKEILAEEKRAKSSAAL